MLKTIAFQGVPGAFSYLAAKIAFGEQNVFVGLGTFREVFKALEKGQVDYGILPIENSLVGSIHENYDLLNTYKVQIIGEHYTKITHCLLGLKGEEKSLQERLRNTKKVFSHPKALEQCKGFFLEHPWIEGVVYKDTASSAEYVSALNNPQFAAIASQQAGEIYGLQLIQKGLEDDPQNYTRFVTIARHEKETNKEFNKVSLVFTLEHRPGTLLSALKMFSSDEINLLKLESRPLIGRPFEYLFYLDFEWHGKNRKEIDLLLEEFRLSVKGLKVLGSYQAGEKWIS